MLPTSRWVKIDGSVGVAPRREVGERAAVGGQNDCAPWVDVVEAEPPTEQPPDGPQLDRSRRLQVEVAEHRHTPGVLVESAGVGALDRPVHAACPALEYLSELVDEGVVGDVAPAKGLGVVRVDRAHDRRGVLRAVVVASRGVVHDARPHPVVVDGVGALHRLIGAPLCAGDDGGRLAGRSHRIRQWQVDRRLRRADQHGVDVLSERLVGVGGDVAEVRPAPVGRRRRSASPTPLHHPDG